MHKNQKLGLGIAVAAGLAMVLMLVAAQASAMTLSEAGGSAGSATTSSEGLTEGSGSGPVGNRGGTDVFPSASSAVVANCRYGVAADEPYISSPVVKTLGIGSYIYYENPSNPPPGSEVMHVIDAKQDKSNGTYLNSYTVSPPIAGGALRNRIQSYPGAMWIVANEPDRGPLDPSDPNRVQDDTMPAMYAREYHDIYQEIKAADPTAKVAVAGLVEATPGRMQYFDIVWNTYQALYGTPMPVDIWTMHLYILQEANFDGTPNDVASVAKGTDPALARRDSQNDNQYCTNPVYYCLKHADDMGQFDQQVRLMRTWMQQHGQQNKPLVISEYSILYLYTTQSPLPQFSCWIVDELRNCFTPARISQFVRNSFAYLSTTTDPALGDGFDNNKLVQEWSWFGLNFGHGDNSTPGYSSNLLTTSNNPSLTAVGTAFRDTGIALPHDINLFTTRTFAGPFYWGQHGVVGRITVGLMNNGSVAPPGPVPLTVYADAALTVPLGSGFINRAPGCALAESLATVDINLPYAFSGSGNYWVKLDSSNSLAETNENDNVIQGSYSFTINLMFLPLLRR